MNKNKEGDLMFWKRFYLKPLAYMIVLFVIMYLNHVSHSSFREIGLQVAVFLSYSILLFIPKSWWTSTRFYLVFFIISVESVWGLIQYQALELIYFLSILVVFVANRLQLSKNHIPVFLVMCEMLVLFFLFEQDNSLFHSFSFILLIVIIYLSIRLREQRQKTYELNKRQLAELKEAHNQLQEAAATSMQYAVLEERTRIARDIHDAVGHSLTSLIVQMQALQYMIHKDPIQAEQVLQEMLPVARKGLEDIRSSVHALADRESTVGVAPLQVLLTKMRASASIQYTFQADLTESDLSMETYSILFRVLQEAITNIIRHAQASMVNVSLRKGNEKIILTIRDNGILGSDTKITEGFGIKGMKTRLQEIGGDLQFSICKPHGLEVQALLPANFSSVNMNRIEGGAYDKRNKN